MATTIKSMVEALESKIAESEFNLNELLESDVSENTKKTQRYQRTRDIRTMKLIRSLLERLCECNGHDTLGEMGSNTFTEEQFKWFESLVTLTSERKAKYIVEVKEGDNIMALMEKYKDVKDIYKKLMNAAEKIGLKVDFAKGIFVKA